MIMDVIAAGRNRWLETPQKSASGKSRIHVSEARFWITSASPNEEQAHCLIARWLASNDEDDISTVNLVD
jgi:hypothetical protein